MNRTLPGPKLAIIPNTTTPKLYAEDYYLPLQAIANGTSPSVDIPLFPSYITQILKTPSTKPNTNPSNEDLNICPVSLDVFVLGECSTTPVKPMEAGTDQMVEKYLTIDKTEKTTSRSTQDKTESSSINRSKGPETARESSKLPSDQGAEATAGNQP
ncbi:hypothetical protein M501DRAFT_990237 [Patellaria atrata CBS 101060]|uniref:Uncharacterized protein n=1 Tax=Patellaria atrata CBS 101060 TaxID=1346257 RepID=A0A9P4VKH1_9PEZI|nr:hypothetical protein M501DRAFT_990237 [Patellaria atrata CBS 101060]